MLFKVCINGNAKYLIPSVVPARNEVVAKVMFLLVSVILLMGGGVCLSACWENPPPPPGADTLPPPGADPPGVDTPPPGSRLWHTVNERPVSILLECILVEVEPGY